MAKSAPIEESYAIRSCQWWRASEVKKEPHQLLSPLLKQIQKDSRHRYEAYKHWARCLDQDMTAVDGTETSYLKFYGSELTLNEALNTLETLHAQIFKNKIVPAPCPEEGDYDDEFQARAFGRWMEGLFDETKLFCEAIPQFGFDLIWAGTGFIKAYPKPGKKKRGHVVFESVSPRFMYVDRLEARHGKPRSIHQKMYWDRWVAIDRWAKDDPELRRKLMKVQATSTSDADMDISDKGDGDQITLWESWHLPSGPEADDGLHCVWFDEATLYTEKWEHERFPFAVGRYGLRVAGFFGQSAYARIQPAQKALDRTTKAVDEAMQVMGVPRIIIRKGSGINKSHIDDIPFTILETEQPTSDIKEWDAMPIHPQVIQERDSLPARMRSTVGVSDFQATNSIPSNIRDGAAAYMDRAVEEGQTRQSRLHEEYQNVMLDIADLALMVACDLEDAGYDVVVRAPGNEVKSTVELLKFSDVKISRDKLKLRILPVNKLARTFSARVKDLSLLRDRGDISQKTFLRMLEVPDIDAEIDNLVSDEDIIKRNLSYMLRKSKYIEPLPYDNLDLIIKLTANKIHECRCRDVDEEKIALLIQYIEDAKVLKNGIATAQHPMPTGQPQMPQGGQPPPGAPPPMPQQAPAGPMPAAPPPGVGGPVQ